MKNYILVVALVGILVACGGLTALLASGAFMSALPVLTVTQDPNASREVMTGWKAEQLMYMISFIVFNLIGIAATLAIVFWVLDRGYKSSRAEASTTTSSTPVKANK
jgi:hypothetical protein